MASIKHVIVISNDYSLTINKWQGPALGARSCSINKLEKFRRTDREQRTDGEQTENSKPEATLIPVDSRGERANYK